MEVNRLRSRQQHYTTIRLEEPERIISHITRVNSVSGSSKIIFPKKIIKELGLKWSDDYIEWKIVMVRGHKYVYIERLDH